MSWLRRLAEPWRARASRKRGTDLERSLLIVSDLHLGRDPGSITGFGHSHRPSPEHDEALIALVRHYAAEAPKRWRIILAGDFLDFVEVVVRPDKESALTLSFEVTKEELAVGLNTEPERAKVKLELILDYHRAAFTALAELVAAGAELVMIRGNHDAEMHWGKVQRVMRQRLAELAFTQKEIPVDELLERRAAFQARIRFVPWCYVEPGRIYLEHGHQYDPYCSFDHQLYPVSPTNPRQIDTPPFMFAMRYFVNRLSDFASHYADFWTLSDYVRWMRQKGLGGTMYTLGMALEATARLVHYAAMFWLGRVGRYEDHHAQRLEEEAASYGVPADALRRIDALHHTPVNRNLGELMRLLFLDRALLGLGVLSLIGLSLVMVEQPALELLAVVASLGLGYFVNRRLEPRRFILPGPRQAQAARQIADILGVPLVAMGHSHQRRRVALGSGRYYFNTGCWLPPHDPEPHAPEDTCTCNLSHLVVEERRAELRLFCRVHGKPRTDLPPTTPRVPATDEEDGESSGASEIATPTEMR